MDGPMIQCNEAICKDGGPNEEEPLLVRMTVLGYSRWRSWAPTLTHRMAEKSPPGVPLEQSQYVIDLNYV